MLISGSIGNLHGDGADRCSIDDSGWHSGWHAGQWHAGQFPSQCLRNCLYAAKLRPHPVQVCASLHKGMLISDDNDVDVDVDVDDDHILLLICL